MNSSRLWEKVLTEAGLQYTKLFKTDPEEDEDKAEDQDKDGDEQYDTESRMPTGKNSFLSNIKIGRAEKKAKENQWMGCMKHCNSTLRWAETDSKDIYAAYALRSQCFFAMGMYGKCLVDIDMAMKGYSSNENGDEIIALKTIRKNCEEKLGSEGEMEPAEIKLSFEADPNYPCMANCLEIRENEEFGRHMVAKCDIAVGQTVIVEESFSSEEYCCPKCSMAPMHCDTCFKTECNFIPCEKCSDVIFCDENCKNRNKFHSFICGESMINVTVGIKSVLIALSTFSSVDDLIEFVEAVLAEDPRELPESLHDPVSKYHFFLKLYQPKPDAEISCDLVDAAKRTYSTIIEIPSVRDLIVHEGHKHFLMHLVMLHMKIGTCNGLFSVLESSFCLIPSIINHSCSPNLLATNQNNNGILITLRPIKKGEQLFFSYVQEKTTDKQREELSSVYGFWCKCEQCEPRFRSIDCEDMKEDANFKYLAQFNYDIDHENDDFHSILKQKCETFLNTYGHLPWCEEMQFVMDRYTESICWDIKIKPMIQRILRLEESKHTI